MFEHFESNFIKKTEEANSMLERINSYEEINKK